MSIKSKLRRTYRPPESTSYAWDISHTPATMYHPYHHSPGALTEYLKEKLCQQQAKRLSRSLPAQVELNIPLRCNSASLSTTAPSPPGESLHTYRTSSILYTIQNTLLPCTCVTGGKSRKPRTDTTLRNSKLRWTPGPSITTCASVLSSNQSRDYIAVQEIKLNCLRREYITAGPGATYCYDKWLSHI